MPVKVNQKWPFLGLCLETWEIKDLFWVIETGIFKPVFCFQLKTSGLVQLESAITEKSEFISVLLALCFPVSNCKVMKRAQTQTWKQTINTWVQIQNFKPENGHFWFTLTGPVPLFFD